MNSYPDRAEGATSTVVQPQGNNECSIYAACAAVEFATAQAVAVATISTAIGYRLGGNTDKAFERAIGYGTTRGAVYKALWMRYITSAVASAGRVPVCFGVSFGTNYAKKHWIYMVGWQGNKAYARDQQNAHRLIEITMSGNWGGHVSGNATLFKCQLSQIGLGFPTREACSTFLG